jgi:hypothetical protein
MVVDQFQVFNKNLTPSAEAHKLGLVQNRLSSVRI